MVATAPFADPGDVEAIWRPLSDAETIVAVGHLRNASQMLLEIPAVAARVVAGTLTAETLRSVCAYMVQRVMLNPERLKQFSISVDDGSRSGTYGDSAVAGELTVTPGELARLLGRVNAAGAFTVVQPWLLEPAVDAETVYPWDWSTRIVDPSA